MAPAVKNGKVVTGTAAAPAATPAPSTGGTAAAASTTAASSTPPQASGTAAKAAALRSAASRSSAMTPAESAEKPGSVAAIETAPKVTPQESVGDSATMSPYLDAIGRVQKLREEGKIGAQPGPRMTERYPSMAPESSAYLTPDTSLYEKTVRAYGQYAPPVTLPKDIGNVTFGQMASTARSVDLAYQAAVGEAGTADRTLQSARSDPSKTPNDLRALEDEKTRALRRVADLAAARREFGMTTPTVAEGQAEALSPAPSVGPRTGGGKEYY